MYASAYSISKELNRSLYIDNETAFLSKKNVSKFGLNSFEITSEMAPDNLKFKNLSGYGQTRIYGFLAERFMSYWFQKNTKYTTLPVINYNIRKDIS